MVLGRYINYVIHRLYCIHYLIPCMLSATRMAVDGGYRNFISFKCGSYLEYFSINLHIFTSAMATELWIWNWTDTSTYIRTLVCFLVKKLRYLFLSDEINKMISQPNHPSLVDRVWWFSRRFFTPTSNFSRLSHAQCSIWNFFSHFCKYLCLFKHIWNRNRTLSI